MGYILLAIVVVILAVVLRPKTPKVELQEAKVPTVKQGKPVAKVFGQRIVSSPNIVWYGDLSYNNVRGKKQFFKRPILGQRYFMGLHMAICHGPVNSVVAVYVAKRSLGITAQTSNASVNVDKHDLFGGDKKEGGITGTLDFEFGAITQTVNSYLSTQLGANTPSFRGTLCLVFRKSEDSAVNGSFKSNGGGGFVSALSPYPKPWAVEILDIPGGSFNPTKQIVDEVANGAHIIYDCLTNTDWGLGVLPADVDTDTFTAVGDQLFDEQFGLSILYSEQSSMEDFITIVLDHINGIVYTDRSTGKLKIVLIRSQCVSTEVPVIDELNIISLKSFERPSYAEIVNEVTVVYRERGKFEDASVTVQDLASVQLQGALISQTLRYPGIDNKDLAGRVAQRDLNQLGTPLARVDLVLNREGWSLSPGDTFVFSWAAYGVVQMVLRIIEVDYGTFESGVVGIKAVEDIFNLPNSSYVNPLDSGWVEEIGDAVAAPSSRVFEIPYHTVQTTFEQSTIDSLFGDTALLQTVAEYPSIATIGYQLNTRIGADSYEEVEDGGFTPTVVLTGILDRETKLTIAYNTLNGGEEQIVIGGSAYLNDEVLRIDAIDTGAGTVDLGRGFLDSVPVEHAAGSIIYFAAENNVIDPTFYTVTAVVNAKVLTQTSTEVLDLALAAELTLTTVGRRIKPYPPAQVKIDGGYFPDDVMKDDVDVDWKHQDRTNQLDELAGTDWFETAIGSAESGVLYDIRYYNDDTSTLLNTDAGVSGLTSSYTPLSGGFNFRVEIDAIRDASETNFTTFSHVFFYTRLGEHTGAGALVAGAATVAGSGSTFSAITGTGALVAGAATVAGTGTLNPAEGNNRTLENGDNRTLENGDNRNTE